MAIVKVTQFETIKAKLIQEHAIERKLNSFTLFMIISIIVNDSISFVVMSASEQ